VAGALSSSTVRQRIAPETTIRIAFFAFAFCALMAASGWLWATVLGLLAGGTSWVLSQTLFNVSVQLAAPRWVVGRALSIYHTAAFGGMAVGSWLWGLVAEHFGVSEALLAAGATAVLGAALGFLIP